MIRPDDQVLDYFIYRSKIDRAMKDVEKMLNGYQYWCSKKGDVKW